MPRTHALTVRVATFMKLVTEHLDLTPFLRGRFPIKAFDSTIYDYHDARIMVLPWHEVILRTATPI